MSTYRTTGKLAAINGLGCLRHFQLVVSGIDTGASCSNSAGAVFRTVGNADWAVSAIGYGLPPIYPGEFFTFTGSDRNGQGWYAAPTGYTSASNPSGLSAIVSRVTIFCPIAASRHIYYHLYAAANGPIAKGAYSASNAGNPAPLNPKGLPFHADFSGSLAAINGILGWKLDIHCNVTAPTYPSHLNGWPGRDPGDIDATLLWQQQFDAMTQLPAVNSFYQFRPYVTPATYYDLKWMQVLHQPADYPIEGSPPGQAEYIEVGEGLAKFSGYVDSVKGFIKKPGNVTYW
jgi:hypothetical protein